MRKLRRLALGVGLAVIALTSGCDRPADTSGPVELTLWKQLTKLEEPAYQAAFARFNAAQNRWHVTAQSIPQGNYTQSIVAASLAGRLPCIVMVDHPKVASFVWAGHLRPIDDLVPAATLAPISPTALGRYRGRIYSAGQFDAALAIFARRSELENLGVRIPTLDAPWTVAEFDTVLGRMKASGAHRYPLDLSTRDLNPDWWTYGFSPMLQSSGADLIDRTTMARADGALNGPAARKFALWFQSLFRRDLVSRREPDDNAFVSGRAGLAYTGNWWEPTYRKALGNDLLILPPPDFGAGPVIGGGSWQWGIGSQCKHPQGAAEFIDFMLQPREIAALSDQAGMVPVSEEAAALTREYRQGGKNRVFFDLMRRFARSRPETPAFPVISGAFTNALRRVMEGEIVEDALDDAVDDIDQTLADNPSYQIQAGVNVRPGARRP